MNITNWEPTHRGRQGDPRLSSGPHSDKLCISSKSTAEVSPACRLERECAHPPQLWPALPFLAEAQTLAGQLIINLRQDALEPRPCLLTGVTSGPISEQIGYVARAPASPFTSARVKLPTTESSFLNHITRCRRSQILASSRQHSTKGNGVR